MTLTLIFTPFVMSALSAKARLKTVWEQVNSSLTFAFAGLLLTVITAGLVCSNLAMQSAAGAAMGITQAG